MAIDFVVDYVCYPKSTLTIEGLVERLKGRKRAEDIIRLYRANGDGRPPSEMGFEFVRSTPDSVEETRIILVSDLLTQAEALTPLEIYCDHCAANWQEKPFGCIGRIEYPISSKGEAWLLSLLPLTTEPLPWLLLKQGIQELKSDGTRINPLRAEDQPYFEERGLLVRKLGEAVINSNQVFMMLFLSGHLRPSYMAMLLIFFGVIRRDMDADTIMGLSDSPEDAFEQYPFLLTASEDDDESIQQLKQYFRAMYMAWGLNVPLLLDV